VSDDRPAIMALNEALNRQGIGRDHVSMLNRIKLDILFPEEEKMYEDLDMSDAELGRHIGPGWWPLARNVFAVLKLHEFKLAQIKEKFAGLRIYVDAPKGATPGIKASIHAVLLAAESASFKTCEQCGAPGARTLVRDVWWKTLCAKCGEEMSK
jgi:hypothetical protein